MTLESKLNKNVVQPVDFFELKDGIKYLGEAKSGNFANKSFKDFMKDDGDQLERYLALAKEYGYGGVKYVFAKGQVSNDIINGLKQKGVQVYTQATN